jgi:hypothetical protein
MSIIRSINRPLVVLVSVLMAVSLALWAGSAASAPQAAGSAAAPDKNADPQGQLTSALTGTVTGGELAGQDLTGQDVTGTFTPLKFKRTQGELKARGVFNGVIEESDGSTTQFAVVKTVPVQEVNGADMGAMGMSAPAACDILNLVLGPLDLNILGLEVHLDTVVLDIVAVPGQGQLLGNLLCAVAGLLDPGGALDGLLGQITNLLNQILGALGLRL